MVLYVLCVVIGLARSGLGVVQDNFLLVTDSLSHGLFQIDLSAGSGLKIPLSQQTNPIAIAYDHMYSKIYWTDVQDKVIKRSNLDGTVEEVVKSLHKDSVPDGIAIDIAARLVYYTDTGADLIAVMTLDGSQHFTLVTEDMDQPRAIVLHPADGLMYWSDWGRSPKIEVAAMDGSQRRILISLKSTSWVNGLTIDPVGKRLYWCDGRLHTIESAAVDGSDRNILITTPGTHFFGIVFVEPNVYYTNWNRKYVSKINVSDPTPTPEQVGPDLFSRPNGIVAYNSGNNAYDVQMNSSCSYLNGGCKHVCLATPTGPRCACPDGLNFVNGTECSIPTYTCPEEYTAKKGRIRSPGYPGYTNNLHCVIIIRMNNTQHEQRRIRLYVDDFDVPDKHDYLLIGKNKVTGSRLQRYNSYTVKTSQEDSRWLFVTDGSVVGRGFYFVYDIYSVVHCTSSSPCQNGGTCIEREYCMCPEGYEGNFCEQDMNTCRSQPCMNGGSCRSLYDAYECDCVDGFTGDVCNSHVDDCASRPCLNGGICVDEANGFRCVCEGYFRGTTCQYNMNTCRSQPCLNGGSCHSLYDAYECVCADGFTGDVCNSHLSTTPTSPSDKGVNVVTVGITVGALVGLVILGIAIGGTIYCLIKKSRNREAKREDQNAPVTYIREEQNANRTSETSNVYFSLQFDNPDFDGGDLTNDHYEVLGNTPVSHEQ